MLDATATRLSGLNDRDRQFGVDAADLAVNYRRIELPLLDRGLDRIGDARVSVRNILHFHVAELIDLDRDDKSTRDIPLQVWLDFGVHARSQARYRHQWIPLEACSWRICQ